MKRGTAVNEVAIKFGITDKEKLFADLYTNGEHRGNGIQAYAQAYNVDISKPAKYNSCKVNACKLLKKENVLSYIRTIFQTTGLSEVAALNELNFLILQNADLYSKKEGLKLYFEITGKLKQKEVNPAITFNINLQQQQDGNTVDVQVIEEKKQKFLTD